jgi:folate-dependent phosphoribosylglycinamide formyltransferase PurN
MKSYEFTEKRVPCAVLMSGSGSNAEALLEFERKSENCSYHVTALVTDAPETSRAREIAARFGLPLVEHDIRKLYSSHGEESIKLDSDRRRELRDKWSDELYEKIMVHAPAFACFAGFVPLSNIASRIPCLNVHPGDLTRCDAEGRRLYAGLHVLPVEKAILNGDKALRSSVILVQPYTGSGAKEMDAGPVLGISVPLGIDTGAFTIDELAALKAARVPGCSDRLRQMAFEHIERLKTAGDHVVFPRVAADFAAGFFAVDGEQLLYRGEKVLSVEYSTSAPPRSVYES